MFITITIIIAVVSSLLLLVLLVNSCKNETSTKIVSNSEAIDLVKVRKQLKELNNQFSENDLPKSSLKTNISDLRFLIKDYVDHLEHHLNQIIE